MDKRVRKVKNNEMKGASKLSKNEQPKGEVAAIKEIESSTTNSGSSTPEISARSRQSLGEYSANKDDENEQQVDQMHELFMLQQKEMEDLKEALRESQEQRKATSIAYRKISESYVIASRSHRGQTSTSQEFQGPKTQPTKR
jgi:hypothetical protein